MIVLLWNGLEAICQDTNSTSGSVQGPQVWVLILTCTTGSILGPALFAIYNNILHNIPKSGSLESYVDNSKLYLSFSVKDNGSAVYQINDDLSKIMSWC